MVQHGQAGPRLVQGCVVRRHDVGGDHGFYLRAVEPAVDDGLGGTNEELHQAPARLGIQAEYIHAQLDRVDQVTDPLIPQFWRFLQPLLGQQFSHLLHDTVEGLVSRVVCLGKFGELLFVVGFITGEQQIIAAGINIERVFQGHGVIAIALQLQVPDHLGAQQTDNIGKNRVAIARMKFFGDRCAADHRSGLQYTHPLATPGEVIGRRQAVMSRADNNDIELCHQLGFLNHLGNTSGVTVTVSPTEITPGTSTTPTRPRQNFAASENAEGDGAWPVLVRHCSAT